MARMMTGAPTSKVVSTTLASAIATILIWLLDSYVLEPDMPAAVASAVLTVCVALIGYYTPPAVRDQVVQA